MLAGVLEAYRELGVRAGGRRHDHWLKPSDSEKTWPARLQMMARWVMPRDAGRTFLEMFCTPLPELYRSLSS